ncbi:MAG TPA: acetylornithine deacetylase [Beijerinckiaceae bacterium]|nr:acetylornithine deacetylase [Beijerinckiaceae bacterium]
MQPSARVLETLTSIIAFDSTTTKSNLDCIDWARGELERHGARTLTDWNEDRSKANLFATFGEGAGGVVLSGHVDTVSVEGQDWSSDPFRLTIRDGRAYGRGTCDMKGFDAVVIALAQRYGAARLKRPIHVALTYDEEQGCLGIPKLIAALDRAGIHPDGALIGEPTSMRLVSAHKGGEVYRVTVRGKEAHSSQTPKAVNAIEISAVLIAKIRQIARRHQTDGPFAPEFVTPHTTLSTNLFSGGTGPNIVPNEARFLFDIRYIPGVDPAEIMAEIRAESAALAREMAALGVAEGIRFDRVGAIPALDARPSDAIYRTVHGLCADKGVDKVDYGTEASFFQAYGVPSVVCGPGSIAQAHKPDEFVPLADLAACERMIEGVVAACEN